MSSDDRSATPRSPHPATLPRSGSNVVQPKIAGGSRSPHPATLPRGGSGAVQPKLDPSGARPAHPATLPRASSNAVQPRMDAGPRPAHPATLPRGSAAQPQMEAGDALAQMAAKKGGKKVKAKKKGSKGGIEVFLNHGKKAIPSGNQRDVNQHAERIAVGQAPAGNITLEQNAWPCEPCDTWLKAQTAGGARTITVTVTDDQGSYSMDHKLPRSSTGSILYANGAATTTTD